MHKPTIVFAAAGIGMLLGLSYASRAQNPPSLGDWHGDFHDVGQARCHPHCGFRGGGDPEGDDYDFTDSFPNNVLLNNNGGRVECSKVGTDNGCVFLTNQSVSVDNVRHQVYTSGAAERGHPTSRRGRYAALLILAGISTEADLNVNPQNTAKQEVTRVIDGWRRSRLRCR
jgi:hypothetical protein